MKVERLNIAVFAYKRPIHLENTLKSIQRNALAAEANLTICIDGLKPDATDREKELHKQTVEVARKEQWCKENTVLVNDTNFGLIHQFFSKLDMFFEKVEHLVVVEDDIEVGLYFLSYMQQAFIRYGDKPGISMIHGYTYNIKSLGRNHSSFFSPGSGNKAFGLTRTYWRNVERQASFYIHLKECKALKNDLLQRGVDYSNEKIENIVSPHLKAWDVILALNAGAKKLLCLSPDSTLAKDDGWNSEGASNTFGENLIDAKTFDDQYEVIHFPNEVKIDKVRKRKVDNYFRFTLRFRFWKKRLISLLKK